MWAPWINIINIIIIVSVKYCSVNLPYLVRTPAINLLWNTKIIKVKKAEATNKRNNLR